jgi:hypothetical protein
VHAAGLPQKNTEHRKIRCVCVFRGLPSLDAEEHLPPPARRMNARALTYCCGARYRAAGRELVVVLKSTTVNARFVGRSSTPSMSVPSFTHEASAPQHAGRAGARHQPVAQDRGRRRCCCHLHCRRARMRPCVSAVRATTLSPAPSGTVARTA